MIHEKGPCKVLSAAYKGGGGPVQCAPLPDCRRQRRPGKRRRHTAAKIGESILWSLRRPDTRLTSVRRTNL